MYPCYPRTNEDDGTLFDVRLRNVIDDAPRRWIAVVPDIVPDSQTEALGALLTEDYILCETIIDMPDMRLELYTRESCT